MGSEVRMTGYSDLWIQDYGDYVLLGVVICLLVGWLLGSNKER